MELKNVEQIKQEIKSLIDEAASQGVMINEITSEFLIVMEGIGTVTYTNIKETRMK